MTGNNIPASGWIVIICLIALIILINLGLWTAWKRKGSGKSDDMVTKSRQVLRNPWRDEDAQLAELARRTEKFKELKNPIPSGEIDKTGMD